MCGVGECFGWSKVAFAHKCGGVCICVSGKSCTAGSRGLIARKCAVAVLRFWRDGFVCRMCMYLVQLGC